LSSWKHVRITYIVPLPDGVFSNQPNAGLSKEMGPAKGRLNKSYLPDTVEQHDIGKPSGRVLGNSIEQALGLDRHSVASVGQEVPLARRIKLSPGPESGTPSHLGHPDWDAERVRFGHLGGNDTPTDFLLVHTEIPRDSDVEAFLAKNRFNSGSFLNRVFDALDIDRVVYGDGALGGGTDASSDSLSLRFPIMTVTWAIPTDSSEPSSPLLMANHQQWSPWEKWGLLFATHQPAHRRIPADTKERAGRGVLRRMAAWDVRVEPFGISVVSNAWPKDIGWDQLYYLKAEVNPFVELALLAYVQHVELEGFSHELARESCAQNSGQDLDAQLKTQLKTLNEFGRKFHRFRNSVWFDSVPNQGFWSAYLRLIQERLGTASKITHLGEDYEDWATYLRNRAAEQNEIRSAKAADRKDRNERLIKKYSAVAAVAGLAFGLLTLLVEPGHSDAILWGWVCGALSLAGFISIYMWDKFATKKGLAKKVKRPVASAAELVQSPAGSEPLDGAPTSGRAAELEGMASATVGR
jgi:hypothetical protein